MMLKHINTLFHDYPLAGAKEKDIQCTGLYMTGVLVTTVTYKYNR